MSCGSSCRAGRVGAEFIPIVTIVADEVGDFAESLVRYDVWEGHGSGMCCFGSVLLLKEFFLRGVGWEGGRGAGRRCMLRFFRDCVGGQERFLCIMLSCGQERVMIFVWGGWGGTCIPHH